MAENLILNNENPAQDEQNIAIQITGLKKRYKLGLITAGTLKGDIQSWWARKRGKEDPTLKIGAKYHGKNETFMALDGIDLTIYKGERIGIIGHNGAGKSTLLKLLARVTGPTEGEIKIDGRITSMLEVGTGFNGELTGRENIYLNGAILGMTKAEVDRKIDQIIDFSECRQFIDTPVKRYSSGMFVKLAFSVAAHLDSEIMIMDEVLAVGDMAFQKKCLEKMSDVSKTEGRTILYVSHNMNTIRQLCDRCIVLDHGKIIFNGDVEEAIGIYIGKTDVAIGKMVLTDSDKILSKKQSHFVIKSVMVGDGGSKAVFAFGSNMVINMEYISVEKIEDFVFSFVFYYKDLSPVTIETSSHFTIEKRDNGKITIISDISNFAPGQYTMEICSYEDNNFGGTRFHDIVKKGVINFEVVDIDNNFHRVWSHSKWGHISGRPLDVKIYNE